MINTTSDMKVIRSLHIEEDLKMARRRGIKKQFWFNKEEATMLKKKSKKVGVNESTLIRNLVMGFEPKEKPDERFYDSLKQLRSIGNSFNQLAAKANALNFIDEIEYKKEKKKIDDIIIKLKEEYLYPKSEDM